MLDLKPVVKRINGALYPAGENLSMARQFPNPEADAIWEEDIELIRPIPVTRDQVSCSKFHVELPFFCKDYTTKVPHRSSNWARISTQSPSLRTIFWGLDDDTYIAALDIFHNPHCLNTLRQAAYVFLALRFPIPYGFGFSKARHAPSQKKNSAAKLGSKGIKGKTKGVKYKCDSFLLFFFMY